MEEEGRKVQYSLLSHIDSSCPDTVDFTVYRDGVFINPAIFSPLCGKPPIFPPVVPRVLHNLRESSTLKAFTFRSNEGSLAIVSSAFRTEWMTVEWSRPPKRYPICTRGRSRSSLIRYMATCRGTVKSFVRRFEDSAAVGTPHSLATASWIRWGVTWENASLPFSPRNPWRATLARERVISRFLREEKARSLMTAPSSSRTEEVQETAMKSMTSGSRVR